MSVSIEEVLRSAGFDVKNNAKDAGWLLSQMDEIGDLCDEAEACIERYEDIALLEDIEEDY